MSDFQVLAEIGNTCLQIQDSAMWGGGFAVGAFSYLSFELDENKGTFARLAVVSAVASAAPSLVFNNFVQPYFSVDPIAMSDWIKFAGGLSVAGLIGVLYSRFMVPHVDHLAARMTRTTMLERNEKTDVRRIQEFIPAPVGAFDPVKNWDFKKGFFLGLDARKKPIFWPSDLPHIQCAGTSGAGKGVFLSMIAAQCCAKGEAVFYLDPKDDEWGPHVLKEVCERFGENFHFVDLRPGAGPQLNLFYGASEEEITELFYAAFSLSEKGSDADFYRLADRQAAKKVARAAARDGGLTPAALLAAFGDYKDDAPGFFGYLQEMAELPSVNAQTGLDLASIVANGGAVYVVGSMRNTAVVRMQRMLLIRLIQLAERRDRAAGKPRQMCIVLDELKYHISRPALEALGAARDKGVHLVLAHQALGDLRDCPADLDKDAVVDAVMENGKLKLIYKVEDPDTAEWLARKSGKIQADDETRRVTRNAGLAEKVSGERTIRQAETFFIDDNQILNLHKFQGVLYGLGLPQFVHTSPIDCQKTTLRPEVHQGDAAINPEELI